MTGYVLVRTDGAFVAKPGSASSYTRNILRARVFRMREQAEGDRCVDNEQIRSLDEAFGKGE